MEVREPSAKNLAKLGYKQTEVGLIPEDWVIARVADLVATGPKNGYSGRSGKEARGTPTLSLGATTTGRMVLNEETVKRLDESIPTHSDLYLKPGDVLVQRSNTPDLVGTTAVFDGPAGMYVYPDLMMRMRFRDDSTAHFFWRYANSTSGRRFFVSIAAGSSGSMPKISGERLRKMSLPLPPPAEQLAIATALSDVDALLGGLERLIAKKRDLKQAAMQQLLTGQTRLPGFSGEWEVKRLEELAEMGSGGTPLSSVPAYYDGNIPWVAISDMTNGGKIIESTERNLTALGLANSAAQIFPAGTVLYAMYASLGECSIAGVPLCTSQAILGIRPKCNLDAGFLYYYLTLLKTVVKTLGQQGTQSNLNKGMVQGFRIDLPTIAEQTAIATVLSDMDAELATLEARRDKTRALKQAMMQELLTGRIRLV